MFLATVAALMFFGAPADLKGEDPKTNSPPKDVRSKAEQATAPVAESKRLTSVTNGPSAGAAVTKRRNPAVKELTGAELYSMHCARCHPERYPNERTAAQWKTIAMHMRVRANLPVEHYRKVLKYLQDNSGY